MFALKSNHARLYHLVSSLHKEKQLSDTEKGYLKDLILKNEKSVLDAMNLFNVNKDLNELKKTIIENITHLRDQSPLKDSPLSDKRRLSRRPSQLIVPLNRQLSYYSQTSKEGSDIEKLMQEIDKKSAANKESNSSISKSKLNQQNKGTSSNEQIDSGRNKEKQKTPANVQKLTENSQQNKIIKEEAPPKKKKAKKEINGKAKNDLKVPEPTESNGSFDRRQSFTNMFNYWKDQDGQPSPFG